MRSVFFMASFAASFATAPAAAAQPHYHVVAQLPAGDGGWDILSVDPIDQRLYVGRPDGVTAIDLKTGKATDRIVPGQRVHAALAIPGTHEVIATNGESNTATLFDGRTGRIRATIPTGKKPDAAAYDPATRTLWVMDPGSGEATVIDPATAKVLATVPIGGSLEFATSRRARADVRQCRGQERSRGDRHQGAQGGGALPACGMRRPDRDRL